MQKRSPLGFTLVELLAVIAIIGVLASLVAVSAPGVLRRSKITRTEADMNSIRTALATYAADSKAGAFPPAYGYRTWQGRKLNFGNIDNASVFLGDITHLTPYMDLIGQYNNDELVDTWSDRYDTEYKSDAAGNENLSMLEFYPLQVLEPFNPNSALLEGDFATSGVGFPQFLYNPAGGNDAVINSIISQLANRQRPYVYVPVNQRQAKLASDYWKNNDVSANTWDGNAPGLIFPPSKYDAYVLVSIGPDYGTGGILSPPDSLFNNVASEDIYHIAGLRAYFLATRDLNSNGIPDFDWRARTRQNEHNAEFPAGVNGRLPNGLNHGGPLILHVEG
jgi:prepilin-type N-terminal cleavage/methylation domain-containing protein